jgi:hypothetical protein
MQRVLARLAATGGQLAIAPLAGFVLATIAAVARWASGEVAREYYVVLASVIPVLLIALAVELAAAFPVSDLADRIRAQVAEAVEVVEGWAEETGSELDDVQHPLADIKRDLERIGREHVTQVATAAGRLRWTVRGFFIAAVTGEAVSLYAVAAEASTPFTFVLSAVEALALVVMLVSAFELRFLVDGPTDPEYT